jgi:hypothetical protein
MDPTLQATGQQGMDDGKQGIKRTLANEDSEEAAQAVKKRITSAAAADKHRVLRPDYVTPFTSHEDAWQRLLSYHLFLERPNPQEEKVPTTQYVKITKGCLEKLENVKTQFSNVTTAIMEKPGKEELILLDKLSFYEEKVAFDNMKARLATAMQQQNRAMGLPNTIQQTGSLFIHH